MRNSCRRMKKTGRKKPVKEEDKKRGREEVDMKGDSIKNRDR